MFRAATEWALDERLPVVYLAANSGAKVGLASEVKQCLRVRGGCPCRERGACEGGTDGAGLWWRRRGSAGCVSVAHPNQ